MIKACVLVCLNIWVHHLLADLNVLLTPNVLEMKLVQIKNVSILVWVFVEEMRNAML